MKSHSESKHVVATTIKRKRSDSNEQPDSSDETVKRGRSESTTTSRTPLECLNFYIDTLPKDHDEIKNFWEDLHQADKEVYQLVNKSLPLHACYTKTLIEFSDKMSSHETPADYFRRLLRLEKPANRHKQSETAPTTTTTPAISHETKEEKTPSSSIQLSFHVAQASGYHPMVSILYKGSVIRTKKDKKGQEKQTGMIFIVKEKYEKEGFSDEEFKMDARIYLGGSTELTLALQRMSRYAKSAERKSGANAGSRGLRKETLAAFPVAHRKALEDYYYHCLNNISKYPGSSICPIPPQIAEKLNLEEHLRSARPYYENYMDMRIPLPCNYWFRITKDEREATVVERTPMQNIIKQLKIAKREQHRPTSTHASLAAYLSAQPAATTTAVVAPVAATTTTPATTTTSATTPSSKKHGRWQRLFKKYTIESPEPTTTPTNQPGGP